MKLSTEMQFHKKTYCVILFWCNSKNFPQCSYVLKNYMIATYKNCTFATAFTPPTQRIFSIYYAYNFNYFRSQFSSKRHHHYPTQNIQIQAGSRLYSKVLCILFSRGEKLMQEKTCTQQLQIDFMSFRISCIPLKIYPCLCTSSASTTFSFNFSIAPSQSESNMYNSLMSSFSFTQGRVGQL